MNPDAALGNPDLVIGVAAATLTYAAAPFRYGLIGYSRVFRVPRSRPGGV